LLILGLFFRIFHPDFLFDFLANFSVLLNFPANAFWACFSVKLPIFGLFFKFTCLFLENNLASLADTELVRPQQKKAMQSLPKASSARAFHH